ncbi:MAG TPA: glycosyltransferase family 4 protein [Puia sp.]|nr:glycosyltransferase family 4 protein [Puia sp.]
MPPRKSIAFVANTSWSIYKFRLYLIKKLIEEGYSIYVLAPRDQYSDRFSDWPRLTFIELNKFRSKRISLLGDLQLYRELLGHYRQLRPGYIFHYTIKANIFGSLAASRIRSISIAVITGLGYTFSGRRLLQSAAKVLYRRALRKNAETWFLNSDDQDVFIREGLVKKEKTFLLPGEGVDTEAFYPSPYEEKKGPVTFLLIARVIRHKGIYEFIHAIERLQSKGLDAKFQLLGFFDEDNPVAIPRQQIEKWVGQNRITYLGQTDDVRPFIADADCIVLPSYREGMPLSLLEGASMCKALIAADTAGCREIIDDGVNGYLCVNRDAADLAEKMERYYRLPAADKRQMGIEGRNRVLARFTKEIVTRIYLDKLNTLQKPQ